MASIITHYNSNDNTGWHRVDARILKGKLKLYARSNAALLLTLTQMTMPAYMVWMLRECNNTGRKIKTLCSKECRSSTNFNSNDYAGGYGATAKWVLQYWEESSVLGSMQLFYKTLTKYSNSSRKEYFVLVHTIPIIMMCHKHPVAVCVWRTVYCRGGNKNNLQT